MTGAPRALDLRPIVADDRPLLLRLFAESRAIDFAGLRGSPEQVEALIDLQFRAQAAHITASYPDAVHRIITCDGIDVGRIITAEESTATRLIDICLAEAWQDQGIGSQVLDEFIRYSASQLPIELSVWAFNTGARALYGRLGFTVTTESMGYVSMRRGAQKPAGVAA